MKYIVMFLMLWAVGFGATYTVYVDKDAASPGATWAAIQNPATPDDSIADARDLARSNTSATDVINIVIVAAATAYNEALALNSADDDGKTWNYTGSGTPTLTAPSLYNFYLDNEATAINLTGLDLDNTISNNAASNIQVLAAHTAPLTITNCTLDTTGTADACIEVEGTNGGSFDMTIDSSTLTPVDWGIEFAEDAGDIIIQNGTTITASAAGTAGRAAIKVKGTACDLDSLIFRDSTLTSQADGSAIFSTYSTIVTARFNSIKYLEFSNVTGSSALGGGIIIRQGVGKTLIENTTITAYGLGLVVGSDVGDAGASPSTPADDFTGDPGLVVCRNTTITSDGNGHCLGIIDGANHGVYENVTVIGGDFCTPVKGDYNTFTNCSFNGNHAIHFIAPYDDDGASNASYNTVTNCKIVGVGTAFDYEGAVRFDEDCVGNSVTNCIIDGGTADYALSDYNGDTHGNHFFDYNIYVTGTLGVFRLDDGVGSGTSATIAELQSAWADSSWADLATNGMAYRNDQNSKVQASVSKNGYYLDMDGDGTKEWIGIPQAGVAGYRSRYR